MDASESTPTPGKRGGHRPGAGRPKVDPSKRRGVTLLCHCTEAEAAEVRSLAEDRGLSISQYMLGRSLNRRLPPAIKPLEG